MKKIILGYVFFIAILCLSSSFNASLSNSIDKDDLIYNQRLDDTWDVLDQSNYELQDRWITTVYYQKFIAQSFQPSMGHLTRVKLLMYDDISLPYDIELHIQRELNLPTLAYKTISYSQIPNSYETAEWIEFDFPDIEVIEDVHYHIVLKTDGATYNFLWGRDTSYTRGFVSEKIGSNDWEYQLDYDICFETYGYPTFQKSLIFGSIYDLDLTDEDVIKCRAEKIRVLTLSPFSFKKYNSDEHIMIKTPTKGIISIDKIFAIVDTSIF